MSPAPNRYHQDISRNLEVLLCNYLEEHRFGVVYDAPFDVYLSDHDVFQPDIVYVANDRLSILTDEGARGAPTLVVEILSKGTARMDRVTKKQIYAEAGVEELWLVDSISRTIEVYRLQQDAQAPASVYSEPDWFVSPCFPQLRILCRKLFEQPLTGQ